MIWLQLVHMDKRGGGGGGEKEWGEEGEEGMI